MVRDPRALALPPRGEALAGLASLLTEAPWTVGQDELERLRAAGLSDDAIVQAVTIVGFFNHVTRIADATGLEFDYESPLPRLDPSAQREPIPRPDPSDWPRPASRLPLSLRPATTAAIAAFADYILAEDHALSRRDRAVIARTAAHHLCDAAAIAALHDATPQTPRETTFAAFAEKLTLTPWRMTASDLGALRHEGLDDRALLHVIALIGFQNLASRVRLALGACPGPG